MTNYTLARTGRDQMMKEGTGALALERARLSLGRGPRVETRLSVRSASSADRESLRRMFSRVSPNTIYLRFHTPHPKMLERPLALMVDSDRHDMQAFVAVAEGEIVGHAMYVRLEDGHEAEMAIIVEDGYQSKGVGKLLLRKLAEYAWCRGVDTFVGTVLMENRRMLGLLDAVFTGSRRVIADGVYQFRAPLETLEPAEAAKTSGASHKKVLSAISRTT